KWRDSYGIGSDSHRSDSKDRIRLLPPTIQSPAAQESSHSSFMTQVMKLDLRTTACDLRALGSALLLAFVCSAAGQTSMPKLPDEIRLRAQFVAAFGADFNLLKSEF